MRDEKPFVGPTLSDCIGCRFILRRRQQMMVDDDLSRLRFVECRLHCIHTTALVEVEAEHEIGRLQQQIDIVGTLVVAHHRLCIRQPLQKVREGIGHNHRWLLAQ